MKKKNIILLLLTLVSMMCQAQIKVEVSEAVELMSILSRTAGAKTLQDSTLRIQKSGLVHTSSIRLFHIIRKYVQSTA